MFPLTKFDNRGAQISSRLVVCLGISLIGCAGCGDGPGTGGGGTAGGAGSGGTSGTGATGGVGTTALTSQGSATSLGSEAACDASGRTAAFGSFDIDGETFFVPHAEPTGATCVDIYDPCDGGENANLASDLTSGSVVVDDGGVAVTAYIFGDNYFELYVNDEYVCRDSGLFTPFNSHAVRFEATFPLTIAILGVDWEEEAGVGIESAMGGYQTGDAGLIARFVTDAGDEVAVTGSEWKCTPVYIAPLDQDDISCATDGDSGECADDASCYGDSDFSDCYAVHFETDSAWTTESFDDSAWQDATTYVASDVTNQPAYSDYADSLFLGADFVWTSNLDLDNRVLCRATITEVLR